jgi:hypothetical protein
MESFDILLDKFYPIGTEENGKEARFKAGAPMCIATVENANKSYIDGTIIEFSSYNNCCSFVRTVLHDCIYLVDPRIEEELLENWINEISPVFPYLNIKLLDIAPNRIVYDADYGDLYKNKTAKIISTRYSQKSYSVEAYLAHHLIRACFDSQSIIFVKQYFEIKKVVPDMYFWNIIFLCQFGLNMYYYFWLTDGRIFHMTTEEEFNKFTKKSVGTSSKSFFDHFAGVILNPDILNSLKELYLSKKFDLVAENLGKVKFVVPKDSTRIRKNSLLRLFKEYRVLFESEDHYLVRADDYNNRRYKKNKFKTVK